MLQLQALFESLFDLCTVENVSGKFLILTLYEYG